MKLPVALATLIVLTLSAFPQSVSQVIKVAEKAFGGQKTLRSVRSVVKRGTIKRLSDGAAGSYLLQTEKPNRFNESYDIGGYERETGFNGRSGWMRDSRDGLRTVTGDEGVVLAFLSGFRNNLWLSYKDEKSRLTFVGSAQVSGRTANVLKLTTQKGTEIKIFVDAMSGIVLRDEIPNGASFTIRNYGDYRNIGGLLLAFLELVTTGGETFEIRYEDIEIGRDIAASEFDFPSVSNESLPDIKVLLDRVQANEDNVEEIIDKYSYVQKTIKRELGKDGILRETGSETVQLSFYKGRRITRLIEKNGKPLNAREQAKADKEAGNRVEEIEKEIAKEDREMLKQDRIGTPSSESRRVSTAEVLRASKLLNPRRERFRGRDVIVFDFEPDPSFDMRNAKSMLKFFGKTAGVIWIDEADRQIVRIEAELFESYKVGGGLLAKLQKGASFTLEKERVNDEVWLPSLAEINLSVRVLLVKGVSVNQIIRSYDYRVFETEVTDATVGDKPER
jgi:hypothetical protein